MNGKILAVLPSSPQQLLLELDALDKLALMNEETIDIDQAAELLGVDKQKEREDYIYECKQ